MTGRPGTGCGLERRSGMRGCPVVRRSCSGPPGLSAPLGSVLVAKHSERTGDRTRPLVLDERAARRTLHRCLGFHRLGLAQQVAVDVTCQGQVSMVKHRGDPRPSLDAGHT